MSQLLPLTLSGGNLGQRHRELNSHVKHAATSQVSFQDIAALPEYAPVDRLFKIDLANKVQDLDYILHNIKDDDMLYVSRALKSKWLLERRDIINPKYLENELFPEMVMPAISKMKHCLYINLRDPLMCQEFYQYYKDSQFEFAIKFLTHCADKFILNEFSKILTKITPHYLKVFAEKNPKLVQVYFDALSTDNELVRRYVNDEADFYNNIKCVLKSEPDIFLDITEKYHSLSSSNKLSAAATDYILRCHKSRFMAKSELYIVYLLDMPTVAKRLSVEECKDLVMKLARADYLSWWFSYHKVEPLVKRVNRDSRAAFKKQIFVDKDVGEHVDKWPYALPESPTVNYSCSEMHVFLDRDFEPVDGQLNYSRHFDVERVGMTLRCAASYKSRICPYKSELQKLFDEFRFVGFEGSLHEMKQRLAAVSSADRRRDILLVLVSKSGGHEDNVRALMQLTLKLRNEPVHERATVVRSLVKRASVWRLPEDVWSTVLDYARGLGMDGSEPDAECREGLHAVVLRQLIATGDCNPAIRSAFLNDFTTLDEYKLLAFERQKICTGLQSILVTAVKDAAPEIAAKYLDYLLDVFEKYHVRIESSPVLSAVATLSERDSVAAGPLLARLYQARSGRRELFHQFLELRHDDAALLNALRHDPEGIKPEWFVKLLSDGVTQANQALLKLAVYFSEVGGIADQVRQMLQSKIAQEPCLKLARPLAILAGSDIMSIWRKLDEAGSEHHKLVAAFRANMHRARPALDILPLGWRKVGMKAIAWRAMRCPPSQVTQLAKMLLEECEKRTVRLALALTPRTDCPADIFSIAAEIRPLAALRAALIYFRSVGDKADLRVWDIVKPIMSSADLAPRQGMRHMLVRVKGIPKDLKPDYCAILYLALDTICDENADELLTDLMKCLPQVNDDLFEKLSLRWLEKMTKVEPQSYPALVIRYLMLSKTDDELNLRFKKIGEQFLVNLDATRVEGKAERQEFLSQNFDQLLSSLKYNIAYFDLKYKCCLPVIEKILTWMQSFMPKENYFKEYVNIHATMMYYRAVRESINQRPEIFEDPVKKMSEGVEIVGFTFGRYVAKELFELKTKYFDSIIELYRKAFIDYILENFSCTSSVEKLLFAIIKGILSDVCPEGRLAIDVFQRSDTCWSNPVRDEIMELLLKYEDKESQFFFKAEIF